MNRPPLGVFFVTKTVTKLVRPQLICRITFIVLCMILKYSHHPFTTAFGIVCIDVFDDGFGCELFEITDNVG